MNSLQCVAPLNRRKRRNLTVVMVFTLAAMLYTTNQLFNSVVTTDIFVAPVNSLGNVEAVATKPVTGSGEGKQRPDGDPKVNNSNRITASTPMLFGTGARPKFSGAGETPLIQEIDHALIPTVENKRRILIVGDVRGMKKPLDRLLAKVNYQPSTDHIVFLGNLIGQGPNSPELLDFAIGQKATMLRADMEDRVILASQSYIDQVANSMPPILESSENTTLRAPGSDDEDSLEQQHFAHGDHIERSLASAITEEHLAHLARLPAILRVPMPSGAPSLAVVHGGLVPGVPLTQQDPNVVMSMRGIQYPRELARQADAIDTIDRLVRKMAGAAYPRQVNRRTWEKMVREEFAKTTRPSDRDMVVPTDFEETRESDSTDPWADVWNARVEKFAPDDRYMVVYGHGSGKGLGQGKWTVSVDMGCANGGDLALLAVSMTEQGMKREIKSTTCGWW